MSRPRPTRLALAPLLTALLVSSCGDGGGADVDESSATGAAGGSGSAGAAGAAAGAGGASGAGGAAGSAAGAAGASGAGAAGQGGAAGKAGAAGKGGTGGSSGASGAGGGSAGKAGAAGKAGGGAAGAGGAPDCASLTLDGPAIDVVGNTSQGERAPTLVGATTEAGAAVAVIGIDWYYTESPGPVPEPIGHTVFAPWGTWPKDAGTIVTTTPSGGERYVLGPSTPGRFALARIAKTAEGAAWSPLVELGKAASEPPLAPPAPGLAPLFTTLGATGHALGMLAGGGGHHQVDVAPLPASAPAPSAGLSAIGCGTSELVAAAAPSFGKLVVAYSTSRDFGTCMLANGVDGPPDRLQWGIWDPVVGSFTPGSWAQPGFCPGCGSGAPIQWIAVTSRSDGAWIVWQTGGGTTGPTVWAVAVDAAGQAEKAPLQLTMDGETFAKPAAAALGDGLAFVWRNDLGQVPHTFVRVIGKDGASLGGAPVASGFPDGLAVLGAPTADALVVGWSEKTSAGTGSRVHVARYACGPKGT